MPEPLTTVTIIRDYHEYLKGHPMGFSPGTIRNYLTSIRAVLAATTPRDLTDPQMLAYLRNGLPEGYRSRFTSSWRTFVAFSKVRGLRVSPAVDGRVAHYVHPMFPDTKRLLVQYYNGISGVTWASARDVFEKEPRVKTSALRIYQFFTGSKDPLPEQPLLPKGPKSMKPMSDFVLEAIFSSRRRKTSGQGEDLHERLNEQMADYGIDPAIAGYVYKLFVLGGKDLKEKSTTSRMEAELRWESAIAGKDTTALILDMAAYLRVDPQDPQLGGILYE